jgi:cytosolic iron-sulfur protein assembly protein CIAO1
LWKDEDDDWYSFQTLTGHSATVWCIDFDSTGTYLASVGDDLSLRIWKEEQGQYHPFSIYEKLHEGTIYSVSWSKSHGKIATCGADNRIHILELVGDQLILKDTVQDAHSISDINFVIWCPLPGNENYLASCGDNHNISIWQN